MRTLKFNKFTLALLMAQMTTFLASCGSDSGGGGGGAPFSISANLAAGFDTQNIFTKSLSLSKMMMPSQNSIRPFSVAANGVVSLPYVKGQSMGYGVSYIKSGSVNSSGDVSIEVSKMTDASWVTFLLDTTQTDKIDQIVGILNLSDDSSGGMMKLDAVDASGSSISYGDVTAPSTGLLAESSATLEESATTLNKSYARLVEEARTDDVISSLMNTYANSSTDGSTFYGTQPYFVFEGDLTSAYNAELATTAISYNGYGLYFFIKDSSITAAQMCSVAKSVILTAPSNITDGTTTTNTLSNTGVEMNSDGQSCGHPYSAGLGSFSLYSSLRDDGYGFNFNWGAGDGFQGEIPSGKWTLSVDGVAKAKFKLDVSSPVDSASKPLVYVPTVKVVKDNTTGAVSSVEVRIYTRNPETDAYTMLTDMSAFEASVDNLFLDMTDYSDGSRPNTMVELSGAVSGVYTVSSFDRSWKIEGGSATGAQVTSLAVGYELYGSSMRFDYRPGSKRK